MNRLEFIGTCMSSLFSGFYFKDIFTKKSKVKYVNGELSVRTIRLWTLGSLEPLLIPSKNSIDKLKEVLAKCNNSTNDIIWGPDLKLTVVSGSEDKIMIPEKLPDGRILYRIENL